jgi:hypothetical protein
MPAASELPESIRDLSFRNAAEMRAGRDRKQHIERLVSGLAESLKAPSEEEVLVAPKPREEITRSTEGTPAAAKSLVEPAAAAKGKILRSKEKGSVTSAEKGSVAPKAREKITHQAKARAAPAKPSVRPVTVAEAQQLSPSVLQERAAFVEKTRKAFEGVTHPSLYLAETIPVQKATAATTAYAPHVASEDIVLLYDASVFGGAKAGVLLTTDSIYWHNLWGAQGNCRYADIRTAIMNSNNNLLINGDKEIVVLTPIVRGLMKLLVELLPDLQLRGTPAEESVEPTLQSVSAEEAAFLEKCRPLSGISDRLWLKYEIPLAKAYAATKKYAPNVPVKAIMLLYDDTTFGGAKEGLLLTVDSIYWHNITEEAEHCRYSDIKDLSVSGQNLIINGKKIALCYGGKINKALVNLLGRVRLDSMRSLLVQTIRAHCALDRGLKP